MFQETTPTRPHKRPTDAKDSKDIRIEFQTQRQTCALIKMPPTRSQSLAIIISSIILLLICSSHLKLVESQAISGKQNDGGNFYERPGVLSSEILRARGYVTEERYLTTVDGYRIRLTRGTNPLINGGRSGLPNKIPIVFIHGILESDSVFVINSFGAKPKDLTNLDLVGTDPNQMNELLASEPSAKSLPLLAMNLGHEVWIMTRRGFPGSQQLVGDPVSISGPPKRLADDDQLASPESSLFGGYMSSLSSSFGSMVAPFRYLLAALFDYGNIIQQVPFSFDRKFWNFSFDQQAMYDLPQVIDYVLEQTGRPQVSLVSHSAGGAIELMALSLYPQLAGKLNSSILWSQGFVLGHGDVFNLLLPTKPILEAYIGSVPPSFTTTEVQAIAGLFCTTQLAQSTLCETVADLLLGPSGGKEPISPEFINSLLYATASHELAQNLQAVQRGQIYRYDYGLKGNMAAYGQAYPPIYNASAIALRSMSFYVGATDAIVSVGDVEATLPLLSGLLSRQD